MQLRYGAQVMWRRLRDMTPFGHLRLLLGAALLMCGGVLLAVLAVPQYDRALVLSGRTEVLAMRLDDAAFGNLDFDAAAYKADPDTPARSGRLQLEVAPGTTIRLVRSGRSALQISFAADGGVLAGQGCAPGLHRVGTAAVDGAAAALCDAAAVSVPMTPEGTPQVLALSGGIVVGEEVSEGAGSRPLLLEATASLLVKHGNAVFRWACGWSLIENFCDRFVANSVVLSPGDSVRADEALEPRPSGGLGFIRVDPNELQSGMLFELAAPATAFHVQRMQGESFTVRESLFDVIEKSPVVHTLNVILVALGVALYFLRLPGGARSEGAAAVLAALALCAPGPARAQQALLRADGTGQALLRSRGDRCYAVTPAHVMGAETAALLTAPGRERGEGDLLRRIPAAPEPVALLTLRGIPLAVCPPFEGAVSLNDILAAHGAATLRLVRADGAIDRLPLLLGAVEVETLEVHSEAGALEQGMSGGTVLVADQPVGLLVDVTDGGRTGRVARLDRVFERLTPHLTSALPAEAAHAPSGSVPYEVVRSNAAPVAPENKVSSLQGDGAGPWRVPAEGRVELVLKASAPFSGVVLDLTGVADPPHVVEILGGRSERGPWQSLASLNLEPGDGVQQRRFPPVGLGYVLVRGYAPVGRGTLAVLRLLLMPK